MSCLESLGWKKSLASNNSPVALLTATCSSPLAHPQQCSDSPCMLGGNWDVRGGFGGDRVKYTQTVVYHWAEMKGKLLEGEEVKELKSQDVGYTERRSYPVRYRNSLNVFYLLGGILFAFLGKRMENSKFMLMLSRLYRLARGPQWSGAMT